MNEQQTSDKAESPRRLNNMKNGTKSIYGLLVNSEEKGRGRMEAAVFAACILSVVAAIMQFVGQPTPDPFAGFESPAQTAPIISHHIVGASLDTKS